MIEIPHTELAPDTLDRLIEEFVTRDGTDTADVAAKSAQVRRLLAAGKVVIVYDEEEESTTIVAREELLRPRRQQSPEQHHDDSF